MTKLCALIGRGWIQALVVVAVLLLASLADAQEKISEEAKLYFKNGVELIQQNPPNYQDAYYQFKLAYEKSGSWKVLGNLGLCALKLERDGEALQAYADYLKGGGKQVDAEERRAMERESLLISGNSSTVNLTSDIGDASVLDARAGSSVPPQTYKLTGGALSLRLRAGTHAITATAPDGKQLRWDITITPGQTIDHRFDFNAVAAAPAPAPEPPPVVAPPPAPAPAPAGEPKQGSGLRTVGFVALGVGGAAIIGGVITGVMAKSAETKATDQCTDKVCPTAAESDFDSASSLATITNVLFIGGAVVAAAGVTLVLVGGPKGDAPAQAAQAPRLRLAPVVGPAGAGLVATGAF
jgi:hypothetical protein